MTRLNNFYVNRSLVFLIVVSYFGSGFCLGNWMSIDELENHISPEDLEAFSAVVGQDMETSSTTPEGMWIGNRYWDPEDEDGLTLTASTPAVPHEVDCFGLGGLGPSLRPFFNLRPDSSKKINTHFYLSSRKQPQRVQILPGEQFGLEWADFDASRQTVIIIHGFMSHSNASWVTDMASAFLQWGDVNVIAVDWSRGGNTWKYWRAVANTRRVGSDVTQFLRKMMNTTGCLTRDFHLVGHSLGAHIASFVASHLQGVKRITGLDPAQPCFLTADPSEFLDPTDAEFVDVIHTNARLLTRLGLGLPMPTGHADFYPNGGMKQPGCYNRSNSIISRLIPAPIERLLQAVCSHGRSYLYFTESLLSNNCSFRAHRWNMTYEGVNASLEAACDRIGSCSEMGIKAVGEERGLPRANGAYFALTTEEVPFCPTEYQRRNPDPRLLHDLRRGFQLQRTPTSNTDVNDHKRYANPDDSDPPLMKSEAVPVTKFSSTWRLFG